MHINPKTDRTRITIPVLPCMGDSPVVSLTLVLLPAVTLYFLVG